MNIILLGAPGSGKGTQGKYIAAKYHLNILSTGDMLRAEIAKKSPLGIKIKAAVEAGQFIDDETISELVMEKFASPEYSNGIILDGFPRTIAQAEILDKNLATSGKKIDAVIELEVKEEDLVERLSNRYNCAKCHAGYNHLFKNPKHAGICDVCGSTDFATRKDDNKDVIRERYRKYQSKTEKLLPFYNAKGLLFKVSGYGDMQEIAKNTDLVMKQVIVS